MSNGLGAGFAGLTLLAVLAAVAILAGLAAATGYTLRSRRGRGRDAVRVVLVGLGVVAVGVSGFGVLAFADEAALVAWLLSWLTLLPLLLAAGARVRAMGLSPATAFAATVAAWAPAFLAGLAVTVGATSAINAALGLPGASQGTGVRWVAAAVGGLVVLLATYGLGTRLLDRDVVTGE